VGKASARNQNANRYSDAEQKQERTESDKNPAKKFGRQFLTCFCCTVARNEYENRADRCVKKRKEREERSETSHDVVEYRKQPQMFFILVHLLANREAQSAKRA
jgi:hypothetical protein